MTFQLATPRLVKLAYNGEQTRDLREIIVRRPIIQSTLLFQREPDHGEPHTLTSQGPTITRIQAAAQKPSDADTLIDIDL